MKILVTGAAGFIGSHLAQTLLERGDEVVGVDNFNDYYDPSQKRNNASILAKYDKFKIVEADICDPLSFEDTFDCIVHLAARAGVRASLEDPQLYVKTNDYGTINLLEYARNNSVPQFVFGSSSSVYGDSSVPFKEDADIKAPVSPYAASKRAGELYCKVYNHLYGLKCSCLRFFTVYGPRGRPDMTPFKFTRMISNGDPITIFGDGSQSRDFTFVADTVSGIIGAIDNPTKFEIYNLGNDSPITLMEFIHLIEDALGKKADMVFKERQPGDVYKTWADISKAKSDLGYNPSISPSEGIPKLVEWYKTL